MNKEEKRSAYFIGAMGGLASGISVKCIEIMVEKVNEGIIPFFVALFFSAVVTVFVVIV